MTDLSYYNWYKAVSYNNHAAFHVNLYELDMFGEIFVIHCFQLDISQANTETNFTSKHWNKFHKQTLKHMISTKNLMIKMAYL